MNRTVSFARKHQAHAGGLAGWLMEVARLLWSRSSAQRARTAERQMKLIETLALGGRKQLLLVSCDGENFLVGTGEDSVQTIVRVGPSASRATEEHVPCC